jgi:hypothetical protein
MKTGHGWELVKLLVIMQYVRWISESGWWTLGLPVGPLAVRSGCAAWRGAVREQRNGCGFRGFASKASRHDSRSGRGKPVLVPGVASVY